MTKVLIVDDEKDILEILSETFKHDYHIEDTTLALDALDAFHQCQIVKFDLICLDHMMPYLKGADFLTALRTKPGINQHTPIIMISAFIPVLTDAQKSMNHTFFLEKPIDLDRLKKYVKMATHKAS